MTLDETIVQYLPMMRRCANKLAGNRDRGDDLVHDTIVKALAARTQYTEGTNALAWLLRIMKNQFLTERRSLRGRSQHVQEEVLYERPAPASQHDHVEAQQALAALTRLPAEQREALTRFAVGDTYEEIAEATGCPVGSVKSRVHRARRAIDGQG